MEKMQKLKQQMMELEKSIKDVRKMLVSRGQIPKEKPVLKLIQGGKQ